MFHVSGPHYSLQLYLYSWRGPKLDSFLCEFPESARWKGTIPSLDVLAVPLVLKHWMGMALAAASFRVAFVHLAVPQGPRATQPLLRQAVPT